MKGGLMRRGYGHMVLDDYVRRLRELDARRSERLADITTPALARAYCDEVRRQARACLSPLPERTPLHTQRTGRVQRVGYTIELLTFESRPGVLVTANLYVPAGLSAPAPAVLATCGHAEAGKAEPRYQAFCQRLAVAGFVVLVYDPINQGERDQYYGLADREAVRGCVAAHNMMGKQLEFTGDWFGAWRLWDGMRALDVLLSRPEVDPSRVGVTGNSGGGTMATWLFAADDRLTMGAPSCFVTTFLRNLENEEPADVEQYPPGAIARGLEMVDFLIGRAPAPLILLGQRNDFFDRRGFLQAASEARRIYELLGADDRFDAHLGAHGHGYHDDNQAAMVRFFARQAGLGAATVADGDGPLPAEALWATPEGQVLAVGATPIPRLIAAQSAASLATAPPLPAERLPRVLSQVLQLPPRLGVPGYRVLRPERDGLCTIGRYAIETERDIRALLRRALPAGAEGEMSLDSPTTARLWLPHLAAEDDLANQPLALSLRSQGELLALDVRGLGESIPDDPRGFWNAYGVDYMAHGYAQLMGESFLGRRVFDVLRTIDLLCDRGARQIELYGRGQGAVMALFVALLDERVAHVTLLNAPTSFLRWAQEPIVSWPAANFAHGLLRHIDLPACLRALAGRVTVRDALPPRCD